MLAVNKLIRSALECPLPNPRCAYVAPLYNQAKTVAWDYLKRYSAPIPNLSVNESELRVDLPTGARISLYGADNPDRLRGLYLDDVILDEYADTSPRIWSEVIRPALSDRAGSATFIGTPKGRNQFWEIYDNATRNPAWYAALYRASETGIITPSELESARESMTEDQYAQEYECSFQAALIGAYYGKEINELESEKRICSVSRERALPVYTTWDLGMDDSTSIWFVQILGTEIRVIDYYENCGMSLDHYAKVLQDKGYVYKDHYLPHDVAVRELGTGRSRAETLEQLGINVTIVPATSVEDGINAVRMLLPRCWFDAEKCKQGLEALRQYQRIWDDKSRLFRHKHDWTSHAADAFRMLAMSLPDSVTQKKRNKSLRDHSWMAA